MFCPNLKNKQVKAEFEELVSAIGENAAYAVWSQNNGHGIDKAPNGEPSKLFTDLLNYHNNDRKLAIQAKAKTFANSFKTLLGESKIVDENGEPILNNISSKLEETSFTDIEQIDLEFHRETSMNMSIPKIVSDTYSRLMRGIKTRVDDISHYKVMDSAKLDELQKLTLEMNMVENDQAVIDFVPYMQRDIETANNRLIKMLAKIRERIRKGEPIDIDPEALIQIKKGFIGFYGNVATNITNMLDDPEALAYLGNDDLVEKTKAVLKEVEGSFANVVRNYNNIRGFVAKRIIIDYATQNGSFSAKELEDKLEVTDEDISWFERYVGSSQYNKDEIVRIATDKILNTKNLIGDIARDKGKNLLNLLEKVKKSDLGLMHERDKKGEKTGFITRDLNYGQHYQDYQAFLGTLAEKFDLPNVPYRDIPAMLDKKQLKQWNKAINKWQGENSERRFIPEYYALFDDLSEEAKATRSKYQDEIQYLLNKVTTKDRVVHKEDLSDVDYNQLETLEKAKQNLSNMFYTDGTIKDGIDKEIAIELTDFNNKLKENLTYKPNFEKFKQSYEAAKSNLTKDKFQKWLKRNTIVKIVDQFYKDLDELSTHNPKTDDQISYENARKSLLRLFTKDDGTIDESSIPSNVKAQIAALDGLILEEIAANRVEGGEKSKVMEIAEWDVNPNYRIQFERAYEIGGEYWTNWSTENTYQTIGGIQPASFWKKLVPKDKKKYLSRVPNKSWVEVDKDSFYYNNNFDESRNEYVIPKRSKYDNSVAYSRITGNMKTLYNELIQTMREANEKITFLKRENPYKLPQIEGGAWTLIRSKSSLLKGLKYTFEDSITVKDDDNQFVVEQARRSDGSIVNLIPTRYMKMLSNPNALTNDIVGSTIEYFRMATNFQEMSRVAPELDLILDQVGSRELVPTRGNIKPGTETKTYAKLEEMLDKLVYGREKDETEITLGKHRISIGKLAQAIVKYTRIQGIAQNLNVILTGLFTNKIQNRLEAISGIYFTNRDLQKASFVIQQLYAKTLVKVGNPNNKDKALLMLEQLQVVREDSQTFSKLNQSKVLRTINQHYWYFGHEMVDFATKGKMAIAITMNYKFVPSLGKFMNRNEFIRQQYPDNRKRGEMEWNRLTTTFYDAFKTDGNKLVAKPEYAKYIDTKLLNRVRNTAKQVGTRIDGQMTDIDKAYIHGHTFWQFLTIFRNFIINNIQTRFTTKRHFNYSTGLVNEAYLRASLNYLDNHYLHKDKLEALKELHKENWDLMDDFERGALRRTTYEVFFSFIVMNVVAAMLRSGADDDPEDWWANEAAYIALRTKFESQSNLWLGDAVSILNSPTAAINTVEAWTDWQTWLNDPFSDIRRGPYKGLKRYQRSLIKMSPFKMLLEATDPRSKMEYLDNQIMN